MNTIITNIVSLRRFSFSDSLYMLRNNAQFLRPKRGLGFLFCGIQPFTRTSDYIEINQLKEVGNKSVYVYIHNY